MQANDWPGAIIAVCGVLALCVQAFQNWQTRRQVDKAMNPLRSVDAGQEAKIQALEAAVFGWKPRTPSAADPIAPPAPSEPVPPEVAK